MIKQQSKQFDRMSAKQLFTKLIKQQKQMNEQSFSNLITQVLQLKDDDIIQFYILSHCMKVQKVGHINLTQVQNLFQFCKAKSVLQIKKKLPSLYTQLAKPLVFKQMYKRLFPMFIIQSTTMDMQYAQALWSVLLKNKLMCLDKLMQYLESLGDKKPKRVHKDLWNMMFEFSNIVKDFNKDYDAKDAWPVFIDNFVQWCKLNQ